MKDLKPSQELEANNISSSTLLSQYHVSGSLHYGSLGTNIEINGASP